MNDLINILPLTVLGVSGILILVMLTIYRNHLLINALTLLALIASAYSIVYIHNLPVHVGELFVVSSFNLFFIAIFLFACFIITVLAFGYLEKKDINKEEYYILLILGTLGACVLVTANHFISFFLGLELLSISLYILLSYTRTMENVVEAGVKYLVLAGISSAFILMGMALLYAKTGSLSFSKYMNEFSLESFSSIILIVGLGLIIVGIGFKMAVVPFHLWTPDVYEGAPAPSTAFVASISKASIVILWIQFFLSMNGYHYKELIWVMSIMAILSMLMGNLLALLQKNVKRILAYSSIAHMGYVLVAFLTGSKFGFESVAYYFTAYIFTILGAFGIVTLLTEKDRDADRIEDYTGLFWRKPWMAMALTTMLLSLAGIPLTAGFIGKYYVLAAGVNDQQWLLIFVLIVSSVIGLFYYLRIVVEMFRKSGSMETNKPMYLPVGGGLIIAAITVILLWFGIFPGWISEIIRTITIASF